MGLSAFGHVAANGLLIERTASPDGLHHVSYELATLRDPGQHATQILAKVMVDLPGPNTPRSAGDWWALFRPQVPQARRSYPGSFVVDITVPGQWSGTGVLSALKPLVDGFISALHSHDGPISAELLERLTNYGTAKDVARLLVDPSRAILGYRALIRANRHGVVWNPADERIGCMRVRTTPADHRSVSAAARYDPTA